MSTLKALLTAVAVSFPALSTAFANTYQSPSQINATFPFVSVPAVFPSTSGISMFLSPPVKSISVHEVASAGAVELLPNAYKSFVTPIPLPSLALNLNV